jgi:hypothetical protein
MPGTRESRATLGWRGSAAPRLMPNGSVLYQLLFHVVVKLLLPVSLLGVDKL